ncbi:MAG: hypothetical protein KKI02_10440 [Planctomycetes bacterium]|nr:hypothetical protein [Planctomycetota bacterium]
MMAKTRWSEAEDHHESLAVCLRAVLAGLNRRRPYDELVAALGLGAAAVAVTDDVLDSWSTYARDAGLVPTAELYGLRLRALHPPEAALGLGRSAEYAGHFQDSYVPLITRALAHHQLALAWRGWPPPCERLWGVITHAHDGQLVGQTLGHNGAPVPLTGPAHQVYVVEELHPLKPEALSPEAILAHAARQAGEAWAGTWAPGRGILTGPAAYHAWQTNLRKTQDAKGVELPLYEQHSRATRLLVAARKCLSAWLRGIPGRQRDLAARWAEACDRVAQQLEPHQSVDAVKDALEQSDGIERVCRTLDDVCKIETELIKQLESAR